MPVKGCRGSEVDDRYLNGGGRWNYQCQWMLHKPKKFPVLSCGLEQKLKGVWKENFKVFQICLAPWQFKLFISQMFWKNKRITCGFLYQKRSFIQFFPNKLFFCFYITSFGVLIPIVMDNEGSCTDGNNYGGILFSLDISTRFETWLCGISVFKTLTNKVSRKGISLFTPYIV